jgi:hypothetical protein
LCQRRLLVNSPARRAADGVVINDEGCPHSTFSLCATIRRPVSRRKRHHARAVVGAPCRTSVLARRQICKHQPSSIRATGLDLLAKVSSRRRSPAVLADDQARESRQVGLTT